MAPVSIAKGVEPGFPAGLGSHQALPFNGHGDSVILAANADQAELMIEQSANVERVFIEVHPAFALVQHAIAEDREQMRGQALNVFVIRNRLMAGFKCIGMAAVLKVKFTQSINECFSDLDLSGRGIAIT